MDAKNLRFATQKKDHTLRIFAGLILVFTVATLLFINANPIAHWVTVVENLGYDLQVRRMHKPLGKDTPIAIVDIDDQSLIEKGRWPWPRNILAELVTNLYKNGASLVALDIMFPDAEKNLAEEVVAAAKKDFPAIVSELETIKSSFDYDQIFAQSLQLGNSVLGFVLLDEGTSTGALPPPFLQLNSELARQLDIDNKDAYLANLPILAQSAKNQGFINGTPDADGVLRFTPLLMRHNINVYGSLGLQAAALYRHGGQPQLITEQYAGLAVLEGIQLDSLFIPTDLEGRILIPFRGPSYTFPYISAIDVLDNKVPKDSLNGKLIFIGCTASAVGDLKPTSIGPIFPGVEIQASVAAGILDNYLPSKPNWARGVSVFLVLALGFIYAVVLPFLGIWSTIALCLGVPILLIWGDYWIWVSWGMVLSVSLPIVVIFLLFLLNLIWGYLFERSFTHTMKSIFGQYVPPVYLDEMIQQGGEFSLEGESKNLSVLFSDIRSFSSVSEQLSPKELKSLLNRYFDPMTEVIFNHKGTIDKYVGDMVMAFWGAPLSNPKHAFDAVSTALSMQKELAQLNAVFSAEKKRPIQMGIGINTGTMNVGDMGSKFRRAYTVIGDAVNLASRLEGQTKFYHLDILVGEATYKDTQNDFVYWKVDRIKVKGKDIPVEIFSPLCPVDQATSAMQQELQIHHQALDAYFQKNWDTAESLFRQNLQAHPEHRELYEVYLNRIQTFRTSPPGPGWDGSFISLEK